MMDAEAVPDEIERELQATLDSAATAEAVEAESRVVPAEDDDNVRVARWLSRRPRIDHLADGVVTTVDPDTGDSLALPLFEEGQRIVADCRTNLLRGSPWLETIVGTVKSIDDDTGVVQLLDEDSDVRLLAVRYVSFKDPLFTLKLAPARGNPFDPTKIKVIKPPLKPGEVRRGRGRPPGSRNRPKEVIKAEREARKAAKK